ncbi:MAG: molybdopterin molybdotransferase MoeA [Negativicutes bacterium]|nr:molybdopterin molybdotransferase MoeA [Negativicutes bacterium]
MTLKLEMAQEILLQAVTPMPPQQVSLGDCFQRVLAKPVVADGDFPPFDRSPLDGYALIASQVAAASPDHPAVLRVVDNIPAGSMSEMEVTVGTAARIMTGAPIPVGATGVVRLEDTVTDGEWVRVLAGAGVAANICRRGEELAADEVVAEPGTVINAGAMGMLALVGDIRPWVYPRPRVALIATGSEVVPPEAPLPPGSIRNSNSFMLSGQVAEAGAEPVLLGVACDDVAEIASFLVRAETCDLIISTGGVSAGDYDLMADVYRQLGIDILFERVAMKPGMPVLAGRQDGKLYIGLSGNPAAASIAFEQLVRPILLKMAGRKNWWRTEVRATLAAPFGKSSDARRLVWARCWREEAGLVAEPLGFQGNGMLKSAIAANALIVIPEHSPPLPIGSEVTVMLLSLP